MRMNRLTTCAVLGTLLLAAATVKAQNVDDLQLFAPAEITSYGGYRLPNEGFFGSFDLMQMSITAPEVTSIGLPGGSAIVPSGNIGGVIPDTLPPGVIPPFFPMERGRLSTNTVDTSRFNDDFEQGQRVEFGYVDGHWGVLGSAWQIFPQNQSIVAGDVDVIFNDFEVLQPFIDPETGLLSIEPVGLLDGFVNQSVLDSVDDTTFDIILWALIPDLFSNFGAGRFTDGDGDGVIDPTNVADELPVVAYDLDDLVRLPVVFEELRVRNTLEVNSFEIMPFYRFDPLHRGGNLEVSVGVRFTQYEEKFDVQGFGGILDESKWHTRAENDVIGPQLMARYSQTVWGRLNIAAEGRGFLGFNFQDIHQSGTFASFLDDAVFPPLNSPNNTTNADANLPVMFRATSFESGLHTDELAPAVELRLQASYTLTKSIAVRAGWTGMWQDGIARPSNMVRYQLPSLGILGEENRQDLFMNGYTLGVEINR